MPAFKERHAARARRKAEALAPHVEAALARMPALEPLADVPAIDSYPVMLQKAGVDIAQLMQAEGRPMVVPLDRKTGPAS